MFFYNYSENKISKSGVFTPDYSTMYAGLLTYDKLKNSGGNYFGVDKSTYDEFLKFTANSLTGADVYDDYTFARLSILNSEVSDNDWDEISMLITEKIFLVVVLKDSDSSVTGAFNSASGKYSPSQMTVEKFVYAFFNSLIKDDHQKIDLLQDDIDDLEQQATSRNTIAEDFNRELFDLKKDILHLHDYYEGLIDVGLTLQDECPDIFGKTDTKFMAIFVKRADRLRSDVELLHNSADHLQDAYQANLDIKLNRTMQVFTVITTIFFPLTVIVGWYGMNFKYMPELKWRYGYLTVILFSIAVIAGTIIIFKKKHLMK